jgi:hypothetical protein
MAMVSIDLTVSLISWVLSRYSSGPETYRVTGSQEIDRYAESIGEDKRLLDNSRSDVEYSRSLTITNSIQRQFKIDVEQAAKESDSASIGLDVSPVNAKVAHVVEESYKTTLSESSMRNHSVEERLEFKIPPRTALTVVLKWKRIWQRGEISVLSSSGQTFTIPFRESVGLEFDVDTSTSASPAQ